ncbi:O-methyltransferase [Ferruginibacter sp.]
MKLVNDIAEAYAKRFSSPLDTVLQEVEDYTMQHHPHAHMLSGHVQGKVLEMISCMIQPVNILEIGTFTGFSALCLSKGLRPGGALHTIELREEDAATAKKYFEKAGAENIHLHIGNALEVIPSLKKEWDLVFIDADKVNYVNYYELVLPMVKPGGFILADNVFFHGEVLEAEIKGKNAKAIQAFNEHVAADKRIDSVLLTVRDGLMLIKKI